jgi:hypothetical protein
MFETQNAKGWRKWTPFLISIIATPFLVLVGIASAGAGHGSYVFATLLFPFTILSLVLRLMIFHPPQGDSPSDLLFLLSALLQFPVYGAVMSIVKRKLILAAIIGAVHLILFVIIIGLAYRAGFL